MSDPGKKGAGVKHQSCLWVRGVTSAVLYPGGCQGSALPACGNRVHAALALSGSVLGSYFSPSFRAVFTPD